MRRPCPALIVAALTLFALSRVPLTVVLHAATAVVQVTTCSGNDATCTFPGAMGASNIIVVSTIVNNDLQTIDLTSITNAETPLIGPIDTGSFNAYVFCFKGDGSDTTFVTTTSGTGVTRTSAVEVSGALDPCEADGTNSALDGADAVSPYAIAVTTGQAGSFLSGIIHSTSAADFSASGGTTSVPQDGTEINTIALGGYIQCGAAGACTMDWTSAAGESTLLIAAAIKEAAAAGGGPPLGSLGLLGVGR